MGLFSNIGKIFNDITGVTHSAKLNNKFQKEFAQNAHQWEVEDLKKAGLNPAITGGGSGANASGGGNAGSATTNITGIANSAIAAISAFKQNEVADTQKDLNEATTLEIKERTGTIKPKAISEISKLDSETEVNNAKIQNMQAERELLKEEKLLKREEKHRLKQGKMGEYMGTKATGQIFNSAKEIGKILGL